MLDDVKPVETVVENAEPAIPSSVSVVKTDAVISADELNEPSVKAVQEVIEEVKATPVSPSGFPNVRQNPLETIQAQIQTAVQNIQNSFTNLPLISNFVTRPQAQQANIQEVAAAVQQADPLSATSAQSQLANSADPPATSPSNVFQNAFNSFTNFLPSATTAKPQLANSISPAAAASTQAVSVTSPTPNIIQNALQSITNFLQPRTTTAAPITEPVPAIISGTKGGDDNVIVEHNVSVDHKIDEIAKQKH